MTFSAEGREIAMVLWKLLSWSFGKASDFFVFAIFPSAQFSQDIDAFEALEDIALFSPFSRFSIAAVSRHTDP